MGRLERFELRLLWNFRRLAWLVFLFSPSQIDADDDVFRCINNSSMVDDLFVNDGICDCNDCSDEDLFDCESCGGCPSDSPSSFVICPRIQSDRRHNTSDLYIHQGSTLDFRLSFVLPSVNVSSALHSSNDLFILGEQQQSNHTDEDSHCLSAISVNGTDYIMSQLIQCDSIQHALDSCQSAAANLSAVMSDVFLDYNLTVEQIQQANGDSHRISDFDFGFWDSLRPSEYSFSCELLFMTGARSDPFSVDSLSSSQLKDPAEDPMRDVNVSLELRMHPWQSTLNLGLLKKIESIAGNMDWDNRSYIYLDSYDASVIHLQQIHTNVKLFLSKLSFSMGNVTGLHNAVILIDSTDNDAKSAILAADDSESLITTEIILSELEFHDIYVSEMSSILFVSGDSMNGRSQTKLMMEDLEFTRIKSLDIPVDSPDTAGVFGDGSIAATFSLIEMDTVLIAGNSIVDINHEDHAAISITRDNSNTQVEIMDTLISRIISDTGALSLSDIPNVLIDNLECSNSESKDDGVCLTIEDESTVKIQHSRFLYNLGDSSGAVMCTQSDCTVTNNTFEGNEAENGGAVFMFESSNDMIVSGNVFRSNLARPYGGALYLRCFRECNIPVSISDNLFEFNTALENGGAINLQSLDNVQVKSNVFRGNSANRRGGALFTGGDKVLIADNKFERDKAFEEGGSLYVSESRGAGLTLTSNFFNSSSASRNGGCFYMLYGRDISMINNDFLNCSAAVGGALYLVTSYLTTIENSTFVDCHAVLNDNYGGYGGAVYSDSMTFGLKFDHCLFQNSRAERSGGAFGIEGTRNMRVLDSVFHSSVAESYGGVISTIITNNGDNVFKGCNFTNNSASYGGVIHDERSNNFSINECHFVDNFAEHNGGVMNVVNTEMVVEDSLLINNLAEAGGAVYIGDGNDITMIRTLFSENMARRGGAILLVAQSDILLDRCVGTHNQALFVGGFLCTSGAGLEVNVRNTLIEHSYALSGGGFFLEPTDLLNSSNNIYRSNSAGSFGGGIHMDIYSNLRSYGDIFDDNESGASGAHVSADNTEERLHFEDVVFANGTSRSGSVSLFSASALFLRCVFSDNHAIEFAGGIEVFTLRLVTEEVLIYDSIFERNIAEHIGGAICMRSNFDTQIHVQNTLFHLNEGHRGGGAVGMARGFNDNNTIVFEQCQFIRNTFKKEAGGTFDIRSSAINYLSLSNCIFDQNVATDDPSYTASIYISCLQCELLLNNVTTSNSQCVRKDSNALYIERVGSMEVKGLTLMPNESMFIVKWESLSIAESDLKEYSSIYLLNAGDGNENRHFIWNESTNHVHPSAILQSFPVQIELDVTWNEADDEQNEICPHCNFEIRMNATTLFGTPFERVFHWCHIDGLCYDLSLLWNETFEDRPDSSIVLHQIGTTLNGSVDEEDGNDESSNEGGSSSSSSNSDSNKGDSSSDAGGLSSSDIDNVGFFNGVGRFKGFLSPLPDHYENDKLQRRVQLKLFCDRTKTDTPFCEFNNNNNNNDESNNNDNENSVVRTFDIGRCPSKKFKTTSNGYFECENSISVSPDKYSLATDEPLILTTVVLLFLGVLLFTLLAFLDDQKANPSLVACCCCCCCTTISKKKRESWRIRRIFGHNRNVENANIFALLWVALHCFDFVSDINLTQSLFRVWNRTHELGFDDDTNWQWLALAIASLTFVVLPLIMNGYIAWQLPKLVREKYATNNDFAQSYLKKNAMFMIVVFLCTGTIYPVLQLVNSRLFGLKIFYMGLTRTEVRRFSRYKLYYTMFLENVPQFLIQILVLIKDATDGDEENVSIIVLISFLSSVGCVMATTFDYCYTKDARDHTEETTWVIDITMDEGLVRTMDNPMGTLMMNISDNKSSTRSMVPNSSAALSGRQSGTKLATVTSATMAGSALSMVGSASGAAASSQNRSLEVTKLKTLAVAQQRSFKNNEHRFQELIFVIAGALHVSPSLIEIGFVEFSERLCRIYGNIVVPPSGFHRIDVDAVDNKVISVIWREIFQMNGEVSGIMDLMLPAEQVYTVIDDRDESSVEPALEETNFGGNLRLKGTVRLSRLRRSTIGVRRTIDESERGSFGGAFPDHSTVMSTPQSEDLNFFRETRTAQTASKTGAYPRTLPTALELHSMDKSKVPLKGSVLEIPDAKGVRRVHSGWEEVGSLSTNGEDTHGAGHSTEMAELGGLSTQLRREREVRSISDWLRSRGLQLVAVESGKPVGHSEMDDIKIVSPKHGAVQSDSNMAEAEQQLSLEDFSLAPEEQHHE